MKVNNKMKPIKSVIVTGAGNGIGKAIAIRFHQQGYFVIATDVDIEVVNALAKELEHALAVKLDVTQQADWNAMSHQLSPDVPPLNCVVNNAGIGAPQDIESIDNEHWQRILDINLTGTMWGCQFAVKHMKASGGSVINIASVLGKRPTSAVPAYGASKAGVINLTKSTALWCAENKYPIRVNGILPGYVKTNMMQQALAQAEDPDQLLDYFSSLHPLGRLGLDTEIADAALYLASDQASFITGSMLAVDGGNTI
jgi:3alpha(or 20beta)-hydroxysteroid dehydrogenase